MDNQHITKAIFPVAGLGTRFLPATKSIPKEILTLVDRPLIDYAVEEAREAGIEQFIFVTSRGKSALSDYFDDAPILESALASAGKIQLLEELRRTKIDSGKIAYVRQSQPLGLGHAVSCAKSLIAEDEPFAVILPDDVIKAPVGALSQMVAAYEAVGGCMVATMEVPDRDVHNYGVIGIGEDHGRLVRANSMVEKPSASSAPSNLAVIGRYILTPAVLKAIEVTDAGVGGEIQLTDAIASQLESSGVYGYRFEGERFDCGSKLGYLKATLAHALDRDDMRDELLSFMRMQDIANLAAE